jgi:hypothetical protein
MFTLKQKISAAALAGLLVIGLPAYGIYSMHSSADTRISSLEHELQAVRGQNATKLQEISTDLNYIAEKMDINKHDLDAARKLAETLKQEHTQSTQRLRSQLESNSKAMTKLREEAKSRLDEVQTDTTNKIGAVTGEVQTVRLDLDSTKNDLASSRKEIGDVRDSLTARIAHNATELAELRKRGERDYHEFDVRKKDLERIGDVRVQLTKADMKKQKYNVVLYVDDNKVEKKDRVANEPITFLVGRDRLRYEFVVNYVDKDRIRGYLSTPKDRVLAAEGPSFRSNQ